MTSQTVGTTSLCITYLLCRCLCFVAAFHLLNENFGRFETWNEVLVDHHSGVFRDIPGYFFCSFLIDETTEPSHINILSIGQRVFYYRKKGLKGVRYLGLIDSGLIGDLCNYVCFRHDFLNFNVYCAVENSGAKNGTTKVRFSSKLQKPSLLLLAPTTSFLHLF